MTAAGNGVRSLVLCASVAALTACATTMRPPGGALGARRDADAAAGGPTKEECDTELPALSARLSRLEGERTRIRERLARIGFVRTTAEAIGDGTAAPGLALDAARSADALEKMLAGRSLTDPALDTEIDWIAANWFDPGLARWTPAHIRALASMTAETFGAAKADTMALRAMMPGIAAAKRRQAELAGCNSRKRGGDPQARPAPAVRQLAAPGPAAAAPPIVCSSGATPNVQCEDAVVVAAANLPSARGPLNTTSLSRGDLRGLGPDSSLWIAFARSAAGINDGNERIYVEGMPEPGAVPSATIGRITVNGDPFSAEYSNVGEVRINIDLIAPERRWRAGLSTPSFGGGGGSPLGPTGPPISRNAAMSVSGPVRGLPLTLSMYASHRFDSRRPLFVTPGSDRLAPVDDAATVSSGTDLVIGAAFVTSHAVARATLSDSRLLADHAGIGGTNGPTTGQRLDSRNRRMQSSWRAAIGGRVHRGGLSFTQDRLSAAADSSEPLVMVTEQLITGGDELAANARRSDAWIAKHVVEAGDGGWMAGVDGRTERVGDERTPNAHGRLQLSTPDARTGTWFVTDGRAASVARISSAALFAERVAVKTPRLTLRGGLRLDWQSRAGAVLSPRMVAAVRFSGFQFAGGAGWFVQALSPDLFVLADERDGTRGTTFVVRDAPAGALDGIDPAGGETLRTVIARAFSPRRDLVMRAGIQRRAGGVQMGLEHSWTRGESLPGAEREREAAGLVDRISSDRALRRHQTHMRASFSRGGEFFSAYYQHVWSFDDSDGPFVPPARWNDVAGEWGRSAGVPRHAAGVTASTRLPGDLRLLLTGEARSGTAYSVLTGEDPDGLAVFTDRGSRARNGATLPPFRKLSLSLSRTVRIPRVAWLAFDVGVRADNVTNHRNVTDVGRMLGTAAFGQPINADAGRSIRLWASLAR
jgi:hypothetical protein